MARHSGIKVTINMFVSFSDASFFRLGLFSPDSSEVGDPLAPTEDMELQPCAPNTEPHDIWIKFLQERIEVSKDKNQRFINTVLKVAKYCSQDQIEMFSDLLQRTLDIQVGSDFVLKKSNSLVSSK